MPFLIRAIGQLVFGGLFLAMALGIGGKPLPPISRLWILLITSGLCFEMFAAKFPAKNGDMLHFVHHLSRAHSVAVLVVIAHCFLATSAPLAFYLGLLGSVSLLSIFLWAMASARR